MSRTTAPLLSFGAKGAIAKTQVYASWRGIAYARRYVVPANPRTTGQTTTRNAFSWLNSVFKLFEGEAIAPWTAYSTGQPLTNRNAFIKFNLPSLRGETDLALFKGSPGALGGIALSDVSVTGGVGTLTVTPTVGTIPTGWALDHFTAMALLDQSPETGTDFTSYVGTNDTTPYAVALTVPAGVYYVAGWAVYTRPDLRLAYSVSITKTGTAT